MVDMVRAVFIHTYSLATLYILFIIILLYYVFEFGVNDNRKTKLKKI